VYLSGGTLDAPDAIRIRDGDTVRVERAARVLNRNTPDVCQNTGLFQDARGFAAFIDDQIAAAICSGDTTGFVVEGRVANEWKPLHLRYSGCDRFYKGEL